MFCGEAGLAWPGILAWLSGLVWWSVVYSFTGLCLYYGHEYIKLRGCRCCCAVACCWLWYLWPGMMTHVEYFHIYENVHICMHENKATSSSSSSTPLYVVVVFFGTYLWLLVFVKQHRTDSTVTGRWEVFTNNFIIFSWEPGTEFWVVGV